MARRAGATTSALVLATDDWECVGYRLHDIDLVPTAEEERLVGHLGPDLLGPDWDLDEAVRRLRSHPDEPIGVALLDQRNLAGIGNLYKVETLFLRGVHPWTRVGDVADLAAGRARPRADARQPRPPRAEHHRRPAPRPATTGFRPRGAALPPLRHRDPARQAGAAAQERVTWWCPSCQAARAPSTRRRERASPTTRRPVIALPARQSHPERVVPEEERRPVVLAHGLTPGGVGQRLEVVLPRRPGVKSSSIEAGSPDSFRKPCTPPIGTWKKSPGPASRHAAPSWSRTVPLSTIERLGDAAVEVRRRPGRPRAHLPAVEAEGPPVV